MEGGGGEKAEGEKGVKGRGAIRGGEREGTGREGEERKKGWNEENGGGKLEQGRRLAKAGPGSGGQGFQKVEIFTPKGTSLREPTSFEPFCVKIGRGV